MEHTHAGNVDIGTADGFHYSILTDNNVIIDGNITVCHVTDEAVGTAVAFKGQVVVGTADDIGTVDQLLAGFVGDRHCVSIAVDHGSCGLVDTDDIFTGTVEFKREVTAQNSRVAE